MSVGVGCGLAFVVVGGGVEATSGLEVGLVSSTGAALVRFVRVIYSVAPTRLFPSSFP